LIIYNLINQHGKNDFPEISKNLARDTNLKIILLDYQNNLDEILNMMNNTIKSFDILAI